MDNILDIPMEANDAGATTIRNYLKALLWELWEKEEGFSGKRPFGNSGWKQPVKVALVKTGLIDGKLDEDGYIEGCDSDKADKLIQSAITSL